MDLEHFVSFAEVGILTARKIKFSISENFIFYAVTCLPVTTRRAEGRGGEVSLKSEFSLHKIFVYLDYNAIVRRRWKVSIAASVKLTFTSAKLKFCQPTARNGGIYVL